MQSFDFKKLLPHVYAIVGFIVVAFLFSYPQLNGLQLFQSDFVQWSAMAKEGMDWHEKTGENVMWSNSMFGGMPTFTYYVGHISNYIYPIQEGIMGVLGKPAGFLFLAMLGFYILALVLDFKQWVRIAGAIAFAFSTYNITLIEAGHETKMWALAYIPMVMAGLLLLYRGKYWTGIPVLGIPMALLMWTSHYQVMYYAIFMIVGMVITLFVIALKEQQLKRFFIASAIGLITAAVSIGPNLQIFLSVLEYNKTTMRGGQSELTINHDTDKKGGGLDKDYAFAWSNSWGESFTVLVPMLYGGSGRENIGEGSDTYEAMTAIGVPEQSAAGFTENFPGYWGPQPFTGGPFYFGAIIVFLFVLGMMIIKSPHKWWILGVSIFAFVMSTGKHFPAFNYFMFDTLPGFNKFRVPNMILVIPQLLFPLLGVWALNDIITDKISKIDLWKKVRTAGIATGGLCLILGLGSSMFFDFKSDRDEQLKQQLTQSFQNNPEPVNQVMAAVHSDRAGMAMQSGILSAVFIALAVGLLWAYSQDKIKGQYVAIGVAALVAIDLMKIDSRYLNEENYVDPEQYEAQFAPRAVDLQIKQDPDPYYRVLDLSVDPFNNAMQAAHHKCIGGYSPAKMEQYQDLIDIHMRQGFNREVLNMLNTKYIISPQGEGGAPVPIPNPEACGNAWFVNEVVYKETADDEILALKAPTLGSADTMPNAFNPKQTAVMRSTYKAQLGNTQIGKDSAAYVKLAEYGLNNISYVSKNSMNGLAMFSDMYYPYGWKAYIDGKETPIYKANYLLRALQVPAGEHKIEFKFHPEKFYTADKVAMVCSLLLLLAAGVSVFMAIKGGNKPV